MESIVNFIVSTAFLLAYSLLFVFLGGAIIEFMENKSNYYLQRTFGYGGIVMTGFGTVVHELSHLIFAVIGRMRIEEVKLFRPIKGKEDGVLGYVNYRYNEKNYYHKIFLVLVGIAPIIGGTITILLSLKLLLPTIYTSLFANITNIDMSLNLFSLDLYKELFLVIISFIQELFVVDNFMNISFWIFMFIVFSIASHMSLSGADVKGAIRGIPALFILLILINLIMSVFGIGMNVMHRYITMWNMYVVMFLCISIVFSMVNVIITFVLYKFVTLIIKR